MPSLMKRFQAGFTIIELMIVVVIIGILAALVVTTIGGVMAKDRDNERQDDLTALQTQLESFYAAKTYYPSLADLNSQSWRSANMKGLGANSLTDPLAAPGTLLSGIAASSSNQKVYGYTAVHDDGLTKCTGEDEDCTDYTLTAYLETSKTVYIKSALD